MTIQQAELERVKDNIGLIVLQFIRQRWWINATFYMRELHDYVVHHTKVAPASPDRILRALRQEGHFNYKVTNRKASEYKITGIFNPPNPLATRPTRNKVKIKVWRVTGPYCEVGVYFTENEACKACDGLDGLGEMIEEVRDAVKA
jgi:hypothetical protein